MSSSDRRTVIVYSSSPTTRARIMTALGERPAPDIEIEVVEISTGDGVVERCDQGGVELAILDGEAAPVGGLGLCRQLKDEINDAPAVLVVVGRRDDAWLATWSRAEAVVPHPIDALQLTDAVVGLLRPAGDVVATTGH
jgi:DNA-binding NarL/FixJ family response regulator